MLAPTLKHEALKEKLLEDVTSLPAGMKLPTVKELMARYDVSQGTIYKVLRYLKGNGYVHSKVGSGIYVTDRSCDEGHSSVLNKVALILFGKRDALSSGGFHDEYVQSVTRCLAPDHGWLRSTVLPHRCTLSDFISHIEAIDSQALILVNLYNADIYDAVCRRRIPFALMFPNTPIVLSNSVTIDNRGVAKQWADHLHSLGHRRIAYLVNRDDEYYVPDQSQRIRYFYEEMGRRGIAVDPDLVVQPRATAESGYLAAKALLERGKEFTAIVCGDPEAVGIYKALKERGVQIGKDVSVIGMDDSAWAAHMEPSLTTIRIDRDELANEAISVLRSSSRSRNRLCSPRLAGTKLVIRDSTGWAG